MITRKLSPRHEAIIAAVTAVGRPCAPGDIRTALKPLGFDRSVEVIRTWANEAYKLGALQKFPGDRRHYTVYGLPGWELPADLDRTIPHQYQPHALRWGDPR